MIYLLVLLCLSPIECRGRHENEQPKVGPKGERLGRMGLGVFYPQITQITQIILGKGLTHKLSKYRRWSLFWCLYAFVNL